MKKNTKRLSSLLLALLMTAAVLFGAAVPVFAEQAPTKTGITSIEELNGKNLGVQTGVRGEILLHDGRKVVVVSVGRLAVLEEDVVVLMAAAHLRMVGAQRAVTEAAQRVRVQHLCQVGIVPDA